ncbi:hypothetical protein HERIO_1493 [Hepatospora eriocheir]|uniref:Uncharacterized protein n=1 Tax=Hepatospora eriocheir TaxID=1081669 RepID=A0A1X0Q9W9_9MICR|nr:hypothetical protein HERIO_1493 [Hepatospora eriocheir]
MIKLIINILYLDKKIIVFKYFILIKFIMRYLNLNNLKIFIISFYKQLVEYKSWLLLTKFNFL